MTMTETSERQPESTQAPNISQPGNGQAVAKVDLRSVPMASIGGGGMFMPTSMQEVVDFAGLMARSDFAVPPRFRMNPGACLAVAMQALRWEMDPYAVIQKAYVTNDRIAYEAQLIAAVVNTRAPIIGRMNVDYEGDGDTRRCIVSATFRTETKPKAVRSPPFKQIPTKNSPLWKGDPDQQLAYYTMRSFARRHCPEVLMGVYTPEEIAGAPSAGAVDVTPAPDPLRLAAQQMGAPAEIIEPGTEEPDTETEGDEPGEFEEADANPLANMPDEMLQLANCISVGAVERLEKEVGATIVGKGTQEQLVAWDQACAARAAELMQGKKK